jgi:hypothetical protein
MTRPSLSSVWRLLVLASLVVVAVPFGDQSAANAATAPRGARVEMLPRSAPSPDYLTACVIEGALSHRCISESVAAIENARAAEGMRDPRLILPRNYTHLTRAERTFVVINLERVSRGLRPIAGLVPRLNRVSRAAAAAETDPEPAVKLLKSLGARLYRVLWADAYGVLASDYEWMYNDGFIGRLTTNVDCLFKGAPDCRGHRRGILQRFDPLPMIVGGAGAARVAGGATSIAVVLAGRTGRTPHFTYTWRAALRHGADGHPIIGH